jgi:hypothetical protein
VFVYDVTGRLIAEYHSDPVPPPAGGAGTSYLTTDHLSGTRVVTKSDGTVKARYDYLPFGEEIPSTVGSRSSVLGYSAADSTKQKFTEKKETMNQDWITSLRGTTQALRDASRVRTNHLLIKTWEIRKVGISIAMLATAHFSLLTSLACSRRQ